MPGVADFAQPYSGAEGQPALSPDAQEKLKQFLATKGFAPGFSPGAGGVGRDPRLPAPNSAGTSPAPSVQANPQLLQTLINGPNQTVTPFNQAAKGGFTSGPSQTTALFGGPPVTGSPSGYIPQPSASSAGTAIPGASGGMPAALTTTSLMDFIEQNAGIFGFHPGTDPTGAQMSDPMKEAALRAWTGIPHGQAALMGGQAQLMQAGGKPYEDAKHKADAIYVGEYQRQIAAGRSGDIAHSEASKLSDQVLQKEMSLANTARGGSQPIINPSGQNAANIPSPNLANPPGPQAGAIPIPLEQQLTSLVGNDPSKLLQAYLQGETEFNKTPGSLEQFVRQIQPSLGSLSSIRQPLQKNLLDLMYATGTRESGPYHLGTGEDVRTLFGPNVEPSAKLNFPAAGYGYENAPLNKMFYTDQSRVDKQNKMKALAKVLQALEATQR